MRFALLGDHSDGLDMARALAASGRHQLLFYSGPAPGLQSLQRSQLSPRSVSDVEEVLADHEIDAVIVASGPTLRPVHLRRALQSECHVLCVHPADPSPDVAYETAMIQGDTGRVLLPLLPMTFHPGIARVRELAREERRLASHAENHVADDGYREGEAPSEPSARSSAATQTMVPAAAVSPLTARLIELEIWSTEEVLLESTLAASKPGLPGWDVLRLLGGEIGEVFLITSSTELQPGEPCVISGRFLNGGLFQATLLPNQAETRLRLSLVSTTERKSLLFPQGWPGPSQLIHERDGENLAESWEAFHPWEMMVERFEQAALAVAVKKPAGQIADESLTRTPPRLGWQDELRALELDDAARRSAERGRSVPLDLQETTEEASFKGTMTLFGCSLIWLSLIVLILSAWVPWLGWVIVPIFTLFLAMQLLRWVVPASRG